MLEQAFLILCKDPATPDGVAAVFTPNHIALRIAKGTDADIQQAQIVGQLKASTDGAQPFIININRTALLALIAFLNTCHTTSKSTDSDLWITQHVANLLPPLPWLRVNQHVHLLDILHDPFADPTQPPAAPTRLKLSFYKNTGKWLAHEVRRTTLRPWPSKTIHQDDSLQALQDRIQHILILKALLRHVIPEGEEHRHPMKVLRERQVLAISPLNPLP